MQQTLDGVKEELSEQKAVNAGLRGELRKFTNLKAKLQQEVRVRAGRRMDLGRMEAEML